MPARIIQNSQGNNPGDKQSKVSKIRTKAPAIKETEVTDAREEMKNLTTSLNNDRAQFYAGHDRLDERRRSDAHRRGARGNQDPNDGVGARTSRSMNRESHAPSLGVWTHQFFRFWKCECFRAPGSVPADPLRTECTWPPFID